MKTLIAVPCMDMIHTKFVQAFERMAKPQGTTVAFIPNTLIYEARNSIAQNAVKEGFDRVLWLDSDMDMPWNAMIELNKTMDTGKDFVTAMYYRRKPPAYPVVCDEVEWKVHDNGVVETKAHSYTGYPICEVFEIGGSGFGCCMTSAALLRDMVEKYGVPFTPLMGMGEDLAFCWRARQHGWKLWCDSHVECGHVGQHAYDFHDYHMAMEELRKKQK